jgi:hypothetical protein
LFTSCSEVSTETVESAPVEEVTTEVEVTQDVVETESTSDSTLSVTE